MTAPPRRQLGFTFLGLMFLVAALGVAMALVGTLWHTSVQREKEAQLLFVGEQYRHAIESFWAASPKGQERLPKTLEELLQDPRYPNIVRHLRHLYPDPLSGKLDWGLVKDAAGGISGVYSQSATQPFKTGNFPTALKDFEGKHSYREWLFSARIKGSADATAADSGASGQGTDQGSNPATGSNPAPGSSPATPPRNNACGIALRDSVAACTQIAKDGQVAFGTCRNEAVKVYNDCLSGQ